MTENACISVIIPSFNAANYITHAIDSVLAQTYRHFEIIIIDDGSTDNTHELLTKYVREGKLSYFYQKNAGLSAARNAGIDKATGSYIALLDADDLWDSAKLYRQISLIHSSEDIGMVFTDFNTFNDGMLLTRGKNAVKFKDNSVITFNELFSSHNFIYPSTVLIRKVVFDRCGLFDTALRAVEDYDMWLRIAQTFQVVGINQPLTHIRVHASNMSRDVQRMLTNELIVIGKHEHSVKRHRFLRRKAKTYILNADRSLTQPDYRTALALFFRGVITYPFLFADILIILIKLLLGVNTVDKIRRHIDSIGWLKAIYVSLYKRY